jgi:hypothetical protein
LIEGLAMWKSGSLCVAFMMILTSLTGPAYGAPKQVNCNKMPIVVNIPAFPIDKFKCRLSKHEKSMFTHVREHFMTQFNRKEVKSIGIHHAKAILRTTFKHRTDKEAIKDFKQVNPWVKKNSIEWTIFSKYAGGKYSRFLVKEANYPMDTCFGFIRFIGVGPKFKHIVIYCEAGALHLSDDAVKAVLSSIDFVDR